MQAFKKSSPSEILKKNHRVPHARLCRPLLGLCDEHVPSLVPRDRRGRSHRVPASSSILPRRPASTRRAATRPCTSSSAPCCSRPRRSMRARRGVRSEKAGSPRSMKQHSPVRGSRSSAPPRLFSRRLGRNGERVHAGAELFGERRMDHAVAVDAAFARECLRRDARWKNASRRLRASRHVPDACGNHRSR